VYDHLDRTAATIGRMVDQALDKEGVPHRLATASNMFSVFFTDREVTNYDEAKKQDTGAFREFFHAMLAAGVYLPPSAYESWFVSTAIDDDALEHIEKALPYAARAAAGGSAQ
jgi:glutamate-1-semialdehyde 2,1-aminomutase